MLRICFTKPNTPRPVLPDNESVEWVGPVEPENAITFDRWIDTSD